MSGHSVQKEQGVKCLILRTGTDAPFETEMIEVLLDLRRSHILRMTLIVEENELFRPVDVALLRTIAVIPSTQSLTHLSEEFGLLLRQSIYKCPHILSCVKAISFQDRLHSCTKIDRGSANSAHSLGCSPDDCYVIDS